MTLNEPVITDRRRPAYNPQSACGKTLVIHEWSGSGPDYMHVHYEDDEAWHVLEGTLTFKFEDRIVEAPAGTTVFVPAGVVHTYYVSREPSKYVMILTPRLDQLITALHAAPYPQHAAIMKKFKSAIVESG